jgi:hypothetical protein
MHYSSSRPWAVGSPQRKQRNILPKTWNLQPATFYLFDSPVRGGFIVDLFKEEPMFSIGQFSRITGLTIKTIRLYHEKELLIPSRQGLTVNVYRSFPLRILGMSGTPRIVMIIKKALRTLRY